MPSAVSFPIFWVCLTIPFPALAPLRSMGFAIVSLPSKFTVVMSGTIGSAFLVVAADTMSGPAPPVAAGLVKLCQFFDRVTFRASSP